MLRIGCGMYIVSSGNRENRSGQIANTVFQVTAQPESVVISLNKKNHTHELIRYTRVFSVSVLSKEATLKLIGLFGFRSGRDIDRFTDINLRIGKTGTPIVLDNSVAYLEAEVTNEIDVGTHTMFIGKVIDAEMISNEAPMTYAFYRETKGGATPESAPNYSVFAKLKEVKKIKYRCTICGYVYDPDKGDSESGIEPGIEFEKLPESWVCPICGAPKDRFEKVA